MPPIAFLALLTIAMLVFAAVRLELNFRHVRREGAAPEPSAPRPERPAPRPERRPRTPELRAAPAGGYWQAPLSAPALRRI